MDTQTIEAIASSTLRHLNKLTGELHSYLQASPNQRALLLGQAFASQMAELQQTVQRIVDRMPGRALKRVVRTDVEAPLPALSTTDDSRSLTTWLVQHLQAEQAMYQHLLDHARLGPAKGALTELSALFLAQSKRIALEAHRFQDL